jgi:AraC family transcriptional regulator of adaptative response/methylated-DNA-[protein]-cysteine methyltransferase
VSTGGDYDRVAKALRYLERHREDQPSLDRVAEHVGLSPHHFQRVFSRSVGISPKRFLQHLTLETARRCLDDSRSVLDATFAAGLSSPGRLHDLFVAIEAVTPGEYRRLGTGLTVRYGASASPFGRCLIGSTDRGVCWLSFQDDVRDDDALSQLAATYPSASFVRDDAESGRWRDRIFTRDASPPERLPLWVKGTNFQLKVWQALIRIPEGRVCAYGDLAGWIGQPSASRAVGSAVGANPISYLIPCHRVIRSIGDPGQYRWGPERKRALLAVEMANAAEDETRSTSPTSGGSSLAPREGQDAQWSLNVRGRLHR